jgi:RHH-type rel operon transcriptional repressor/antitoxin RelB
VTTIELSPELESRLDDLAKKTGRDRAVILQMAVENGIEDIVDYFEASAVLERVRRGDEKVFSSREVRDELGLDD